MLTKRYFNQFFISDNKHTTIFVISPIILSQTLVPANRVYMLYITYPWALRATGSTLSARKPLPYSSEWTLTGTKV